MAANPRYDGRPLLRLLELYVLWAIGELSAADETKLVAMAPNLHRTYDSSGTWQNAIEAAMHFPEDLPAKVRSVWENNTGKALTAGVVLEPQQFAEMFVDANFAG